MTFLIISPYTLTYLLMSFYQWQFYGITRLNHEVRTEIITRRPECYKDTQMKAYDHSPRTAC